MNIQARKSERAQPNTGFKPTIQLERLLLFTTFVKG